jgi:GNAT superfamily N-acetyltransferase
METREMRADDFQFSTDKSLLDRDVIYDFLSTSYWSPNIPRSIVENCIRHAICIGVFHDSKQVGFARVITDESTFAYLADVFIVESYRGRGLSKKLMEFISSFEFVPGLRRFLLATRDAHGLYEQFGFRVVERADRFMEIHKPEIYQTS